MKGETITDKQIESYNLANAGYKEQEALVTGTSTNASQYLYLAEKQAEAREKTAREEEVFYHECNNKRHTCRLP